MKIKARTQCFAAIYAVFILTGITSLYGAETETNGLRIFEQEILSVSNEQISFTSFWARVMKKNPQQAIIGIGRDITADMQKKGSGGTEGRYFIKRFLPEEGLFGADIISLGNRAKINHIVNVRRVIQGYLEEKYQYETNHAESLAYFILIYNAVIRSRAVETLAGYSSEISNYIPTGKLGIDLNYKNWPGNTFIVVPVRRSAFSAAEIARETDNIPAAQGSAQNQKEDFIQERKEQLAVITNELTQEAAAIKKEEEIIAEDKKILETQKGQNLPPDAQQKIKEKEEEIAQRETVLTEKKEKLQDEIVRAADEAEAIKSEEKKILDEKITTQTTDLAKEETRAKEEKAQEKLSMGKIFFLKTSGISGSHLVQKLMSIDPVTDTADEIKLKGVSGRHLAFFENDPILVLFDDPSKMQLYLARVDRLTFTVKHRAKENVLGSSQIWLFNGHIYIIGLEGAKSILLKYTPEMTLAAKSDTEIFNDTDITFTEGKLYCTVMKDKKNSYILVLNETDLKELKTIQ